MEIGLCLPPHESSTLPSNAFDFIEANVQSLLVPEADDATWKTNLAGARAALHPIRAANCFLPGALRCVGPEVDRTRLLRYAETAFRRAQEIGIEVIVFGSGAARALPDDFSPAEAMEQFVELLCACGPLAERFSVILVVEPLNRTECNFINSLSDGAAAVTAAGHPHVRLLADTFHMLMDGESCDEITRFGPLLRHVHVAERAERGWPGRSSEDQRPFYSALKGIGYRGRIAIECHWDDIARDVASSTSFLRGELTSIGL